jgi:hypothetical protein
MQLANPALANSRGQRDGNDVLRDFYNYVRSQEKALDGYNQGTLLHGPGGLFNTPGLEEPIISLHVNSRGLGQLLPAYPSNSTNPFFGLLTGFSDDIGSEPVNPCDDAPSGYVKSGTLTAKFGRVARGSKEIRIPDTLFQVNSGETMDLQLIGSILNPDNRGVLYPNQITEEGLLDMVTKAEMITMGVRFERKMAKLLWQGLGNGTNDTAGGGYIEFPGIDAQVATGQTDAQNTGVLLPGADSTIWDFAYQAVDGGADLVGAMEEVVDYLENLAMDTGVDPVEWVIVMRPQAWRAVSAMWPIQYNTQPDYTTITGTEHRVILDARENVRDRDAMRQGLYLDLNGKRYNVVLDTGIVEQNNQSGAGLLADEFASSIYFLPLSIVGGMPVLYWEYLDHRLGVPQSNLVPGLATWFTDQGRFLWSWKTDYTCFKLRAEIDTRVVLRTPHLAAKIQDIKYSRRLPLRDPDPASVYHVDGGVSNLAPATGRAAPTTYAPWLL